MKHLRLAVFLIPVIAWSSFGARPLQDKPNTIQLNGHTFTLPTGFTIELVAGPPLVERPISIDFDEQGRLYVTESSGSNEKVETQLQKKPHRVLRLESTRSDGKFDKRTIFADQMMFPEGVMYSKGSVYVAAPPSIWKLTDTDGDGIADQRTEWFQGKTLTGCANDLHGPYLGPDGWIYWGKGAFAKQTYDIPGKAPFVTRAAHIFRARADGTGVEPVMTGGMDNPVDVVFTPGGERIFNTTFLQYPGGGKRDGLIHAVYGGVYGKEHHDVIDSHIWTGPSIMPPLTHMGAAAPAGLHRYESSAFGPGYKDNIICCCFNMRKISRHVLVPDGSTFKTQDSDLLVSDNVDFHPTDVIEDADGSLLVVDTGGWYKLCCPTSQLVKPNVFGGIYRIRKLDAPRVNDPRGLALDWAKMTPDDLTKLLNQAPFIRKRAIEALADRGTAALGALTEAVERNTNAIIRQHALWAATRIDAPAARALVRKGLKAPDPTGRQVAIHSAAVWRDGEALPLLLDMLKSEDAPNRRAAAEALGRLGDKTAVKSLLDVLAEPVDRVLEHSLIYALIEIGDAEATAAGLNSGRTSVGRAAMIALDQMPKAGLKAETVALELGSNDPRMKEAAWWIASRHPDWGNVVVSFLRERLAVKNLAVAEQNELAALLAKFCRGGPVQKLLADELSANTATREARQTVLAAMAQSGVKQLPDAWAQPLALALAESDADLVQHAINTARTWRDPKQKSDKLTGPLLAVSNNGTLTPALRISALAAVPGGLAKIDPAQLELLLANVDADKPAGLRSSAADVLSRSKLTREQLRALIVCLKSVGPMEIDRVLSPFAGSADDAIGMELITALRAAPAKSSLRADALKPRLVKFGPAVQKQAAELYDSLNVDAARQTAMLEKLLKTSGGGDVSRGQIVFNSQKAACFTCHAIGYLGGSIGPDLTHIARTRTERDLLEAIVFPSLSFTRGYEPVQVTTKDGKQLNGVLRRDAADEIVLAVAANQEVRVGREDIEDMRPSQVSVMPAGYEQLLTPRELADLLAFMKACK